MIAQQISEFNRFLSKPFASSSSDDQEPIKEKNFRVHIFIGERALHRPDRKLNVALFELPLQGQEISFYDGE
jgi:hypothetical protein